MSSSRLAPHEEASPRPSSSFTAVDPPIQMAPLPVPPPLRSPLDSEIARDNEHFAHWGGDDPEEPARKERAGEVRAPTPPPEDQKDPHKVDWDGPDDPANPQNFSTAKKWMTIACTIIMTVNVTFASSAPSSATPFITQQFAIPTEVSYLVTSLFLVGYTFGPVLWGPGSEILGRKPILVFTMCLYTLFILGQALAQNIETLLITRFLSGLFAVAPLIISGGIIADCFDAKGRGAASSLFSASVFLGPVLGPIVSSFVAVSSLGWRWVFWIMMIFAGVCTIITAIFLPETYAPILLKRKADRLRKEEAANRVHVAGEAEHEPSKIYADHENQDWSIRGIIHRTLQRPFIMLGVEPILVLVTIYMSLVYGVLYGLFEAFPVIFVTVRGFTLTQNGLIFIGVGIGTSLGSVLNLYLGRKYPTLIVRWKGFPPPEQRLLGSMFGGPMLVVGVFWLGWTGNYASVPWYVPAISTILIGMSISVIFMSFISYIIEVYLMYSASAMAANTIMRSLVAAAFPLFTTQMFEGMTVKWAATLLGVVSLVLAPSPFLFYKYGARVRGRSKFAPCIDLKIAKQLEIEDRELAEKQERKTEV